MNDPIATIIQHDQFKIVIRTLGLSMIIQGILSFLPQFGAAGSIIIGVYAFYWSSKPKKGAAHAS